MGGKIDTPFYFVLMKSETKHFSILYTAVISKNWPLKPTTSTVSPALTSLNQTRLENSTPNSVPTWPSPVPSLENLLASGDLTNGLVKKNPHRACLGQMTMGKLWFPADVQWFSVLNQHWEKASLGAANLEYQTRIVEIM